MGHFTNELELVSHRTIRDAFVYAGLISNGLGMEASVDVLLRKYILEQLAFLPVGTRGFDHYCVVACNLIRNVLINNTLPVTELPPVLYTSLKAYTSDEVETHICQSREHIINAIETEVTSNLPANCVPSKDQLLNATKQQPVSWNTHLL